MSPILDTIGGLKAYGFASLPGGSGWLGIYSQTYTSNIQDMEIDSNNNLYISGGSNSPGSPNPGGGLVGKLNASGDVQWSRVLYTGYGGSNSGVGVDASGNVYVSGTYIVGSDEGNYRRVAIKYDSNGSLQWRKIIRRNSSPNPDEIGNGMAVFSDGTNVLVGRMGNGAWLGINAYDTNGNYLWHKIYQPSGSQQFVGAYVGSDGYVWCGATHAGSGAMVKSKIAATSSSALDNTAGFEPNDPGQYHHLWNVFVNSNASNAFYAGNNDPQTGAVAVKTDSSNSVTGTNCWAKKFTSTYTVGLNGVAHDSSSGNTYVSGSIGRDGTYSDGLLIKLDSNGSIIWARRFESTYTSVLSQVRVSSNGKQVYCGGYVYDAANKIYPFIVNVPANGSRRGTYSVGSFSVQYTTASITKTDLSPSDAGGHGVNSGTTTVSNLGGTDSSLSFTASKATF